MEAGLTAQATIQDIETLAQGLPAGVLSQDAGLCELYGQDVADDRAPVEAVARPASTADLVAVVRAARASGRVLAPRGGGMSYSSGYLCSHPHTWCVDLSAMDRIREINREDMYVTAEAGCTWQSLHQALAPLGLRTPFWGTLSGLKATIGGGLSQNSAFWGSARHGAAVDSLIGLEVVLASGEVLHTGSSAQLHATPFFRHYGPDLTGLFAGDTGAFGIKAAATLKLLPDTRGRAWVSFDFPHHVALFAALSGVSRQGLTDAGFAFDPTMQAQRMKRESLLTDVKALGQVMTAQNGLLKGIKAGVRVAAAGRRFVDESRFAAHFMVEERLQETADAGAAAIRQICRDAGGREVENTVPKVARANPFAPLNSMIGPAGERWLPVHGIVAHSRAVAVHEAIEALFARHASAMQDLKIRHGALFTTVDANGFLIEPVFYWPDALNSLHRQSVEDRVLRRVNQFPENLPARELVMRLRAEITALFRDQGAVHLQIGRHYLYQEGLEAPARQTLIALKQLLDPDGIINPGALGL